MSYDLRTIRVLDTVIMNFYILPLQIGHFVVLVWFTLIGFDANYIYVQHYYSTITCS